MANRIDSAEDIVRLAVPALQAVVPLLRGGNQKKSAAALCRVEEVRLSGQLSVLQRRFEGRDDVPADVAAVLESFTESCLHTVYLLDMIADILVGDDDAD